MLNKAVRILLRPLSWLFRLIVVIRYFLYRFNIKKIVHFSVPVIVVGNITVGGTGKTPVVLWLANFLQLHGYKPGIVSRGVGGKQSRSPCWVTVDSDPKRVGDEAILLAKRSRCPIVICIDRVAAVRELLSKTNCTIIISDDGLQHYRLGRTIEIAMIDGARGLGNQCFLPAGPLRESVRRLNRVDFIIRQGGERKQNEFLMQLCGDTIISLQDENKKIGLENFKGRTIHAVAGIGNPQRFFAVLRERGLIILEHPFPDHYLYKANDFKFSDHFPIIMTEKDAVKCGVLADERFWYWPVEAVIEKNFEQSFLTKLQEKK